MLKGIKFVMAENNQVLANRYKIEKIAGNGGTSVVYKAYDLQAEGAVRAIKEISKSNVDIYDMARLESQLIKELYEKDQSNAFFPNIIHRFEIGDKFYIVQDYLDGESMDYLLKAGAMPYATFIEAAKQICSFMRFFHSTGRVHSDMKPENIMVLKPSLTLTDNGDPKKNVKLKFIDFGTAIKNETGVTGYTPEYAAPEQYRETKLDERTDIFNIGATFFHMIQGRKPLRVFSDTRLVYSDERFKFDKNTNIGIKRIIQKCVNDDPDKRYKSCDALYRDLCRVEKHSYLRLIIISFAVTVFSFAASGFSAYQSNRLAEQDSNNLYSESINKGDYASAIKIDHTNRDSIYIKLIESFTADDKLDTQENSFIINEIKGLDSIKESDSDYGRCMYEIGNAYWLYYYPYDDSNEDEQLNDLELEQYRINTSYEWLEKAISNADFESSDPDAYQRAKIFYSIGKFYAEIDRKERDGTDSGEFYTNMWSNITELAEYIDDSNEVVSARVCQTILSLISRYSAKFRQNGCTQESQLKILDHIQKKIYQSDGTITFQNNYSINIAENFDMDAVRLKLTMAYAD